MRSAVFTPIFVIYFTITAITWGISANPTCTNSAFAPCACKKSETIKQLQTRDGRNVEIKFTEFVCVNKPRKPKRAAKWVKNDGLQCVQISSPKTVHRSTNGDIIEEEIAYNSGCELRCVKWGCEKGHGKAEYKNKTIEKNLDHICKNDGTRSFCKLLVSFLK